MLTTDKEKLANEFLELFTDVRTSEATDWQQNAVDNEAFLNSIQIPEDVQEELEKQGKPVIVDNETLVLITQMANMMTENNPGFKATGIEPYDNKPAAHISELFHYIWSNSHGQRQVKRLVLDLLTTGKAVIMDYVDRLSDYGRGDILFKALDPKRHFVSPDSVEIDCSDSPYDILAHCLTLNEIKRRGIKIDENKLEAYKEEIVPEPDNLANPQNQQKGIPTSLDDKYLVLEGFFKIFEERVSLYDPDGVFDVILTKEEFENIQERKAFIKMHDSGKIDYIILSRDYEELDEFYKSNNLQNTDGIFHTAIDQNGQQTIIAGIEGSNPEMQSIPNTQTQLVYTNVKESIGKGFLIVNNTNQRRVRRILYIGGQIIADEVIDRKDSPIKCILLHHFRNPYSSGDVTLLRSLQEQLNAVELMIINYSQNLVNWKAFVPSGNTTLVNAIRERGGKPGLEIFEVNDESGKGVQFIPTPQMPVEFYRQKDDIKRQMQRIVGVSSFQEGDTAGAPRTRGATFLMNDLSSSRAKAKQNLITDLLNRMAKGILAMIPKVYTDRKIIKLSKPSGGQSVLVLNDDMEYGNTIKRMNDTQVNCDIEVVTETMLPTNRDSKLEKYFMLYQQGFPELHDEILRLSGVESAEELIRDNSTINRQAQTIQQMEERIKELEGDMQTREREISHANQRAETANFKARLKGIEADVNAEAKITKNKIQGVTNE